MPKKLTPPKETKDALTLEVRRLLLQRYSLLETVEVLLSYYSSFDLIAIRDELKAKK